MKGVIMMDCSVDEAYKFGCGRYIQCADASEKIGEEVLRYGRKVLVISGNKAFESIGEKCVNSLKKAGCTYKLILYSGFPTIEKCNDISSSLKDDNFDVVVGIGGGRIMDFSKMIAATLSIHLINLPTISATCAAFTPLSVVYTSDGKTIGSWFYRKEVDCVIVDESLLSRQPLRYLAAGILDSLAKSIEISHYVQDFSPKDFDLAVSKAIADHITNTIYKNWRLAFEDLSLQHSSSVLNEFHYLLIPSTGIVSGCARGARQSALAHVLYEQVRVHYPRESQKAIHGEIVGVGLRMQLAYNREYKEQEKLEKFMKEIGAPINLQDVGVELTENFMNCFIQHVIKIKMISDTDLEKARLREAMMRCYS